MRLLHVFYLEAMLNWFRRKEQPEELEALEPRPPDDVTLRRKAPTLSYLAEAVEAVLAGRRPDPAETPPFGCIIVRYGG